MDIYTSEGERIKLSNSILITVLHCKRSSNYNSLTSQLQVAFFFLNLNYFCACGSMPALLSNGLSISSSSHKASDETNDYKV